MRRQNADLSRFRRVHGPVVAAMSRRIPRASTVKSILSIPLLYDVFQFVARGSGYRERLARMYIRARPGDKVLDLGCGTGAMLACLPDVDYVGIDMSQAYIDACRRRHGGRGSFHCALLTADTVGRWCAS